MSFLRRESGRGSVGPGASKTPSVCEASGSPGDASMPGPAPAVELGSWQRGAATGEAWGVVFGGGGEGGGR